VILYELLIPQSPSEKHDLEI